LGEAIIEKLTGAGISTVEALADMTPEQLEAIPGIGPKTVEKISMAVGNYFASLEAGEAPGEAPDYEVALDQPAPEETTAPADDFGPDSGGQSGDTVLLSRAEDGSFESPSELYEEEQSFEAAELSGADNAPPADDAEVTTHDQHPGEENIPPEKK